MSANSDHRASCADSLEALKDDLRSVHKLSSSRKGGYFPYVASSLEKYVRGHSAILITKTGTGLHSGEFHLLLHRVPPRNERAGPREGHVSCAKSCDRSCHTEANGVFVVHHLGEVTDQVISAGKSWSCSMWFLSKNLIDDELGQRGVLLPLPLLDDALNAEKRVGPGIVLVESHASSRPRRREEGLIERVLCIDERVSQKAGYVGRQGGDQSDYS